jgi:pre-mRNA-splicing helicase BRR2
MIFCHSSKKDYYKKFLYEPFPVESHLNRYLADHLNAEIANKTITTKQGCLDYLVHTLLYRRLRQNPNYYNLHGTSHRHLSEYLSDLIENTLNDLQTAKCIAVEDQEVSILNLGMIAAHYYINYVTVELFSSSLTNKTKLRGLVEILSAASEFDNMPVRKKEDQILSKVAAHLPLKIEKAKYTDPHTKVNILLQSHFSRTKLNVELEKDKEQVLSQSTKLIQAMVDVTSSQFWLTPSLAAMELSQMVVQAMWDRDPFLLQLPYFDKELAQKCSQNGIESIYDLIEMEDDARNKLLLFTDRQMQDVARALNRYPNIDLEYQIEDQDSISAGSTVTVNLSFDVEEQNTPVHAPFFPKEKTEEWWIVVGDPSSNHLASIRRRLIQKKTDMQLKFQAPSTAGEFKYKLYLMCDSYMGVDHEYEMVLNVQPAATTNDNDQEMQDA